MRKTDVNTIKLASDLRIVMGRIVRRLRHTHEDGELSLSELSVLARLDREGPASLGELAEEERVSPQAMTTIVAVLERGGLATRVPDPTDGRRFTVSVSGAGTRLLNGRRSVNVQRMMQALEACLTENERQQVLAAIPLLERLLDEL